MTDMDRVINICEERGYGVDANFMTGKIIITDPSKRNKRVEFKQAASALTWLINTK